ncbi:antibiotic biosynthesis monooxygenase family protein [Candidatus Igneacidithiobacillus taiwanensis]|uniref:antibiotic biosynthesis monooxygenase family protein n=1 Tax=Candidatus Igneacidithiobacillus taiwanensis TaxID=1945924 RepID=UPI00289ABD6B|nr:antibiotic biosynthesis monooxygenase family protein [Candidatus Igneacidithiobacillus taiwanensis]
MMQYVVANRVPVKAEYRAEFEERFRKRAGEVEKQAGFVRMEILRPVDEKGMYVVLTHWENKAAFEAWLRSDDFKAAHQNPLPKEAFGEGGGLEQHEVIIAAG